jgi:glycosyltransferase involved in cell wall biosynthesis
MNGIKVVYIITGLQTGGAEMMLFKLLSHMDRSRFVPFVISLTPAGIISEKIGALDIPVISLNMNSGVSFSDVMRLIKACREIQPDVIQGWMVHGNAASILAGLISRTRVLWGVRHSSLPTSTENRMTTLLDKLLSWVSFFPNKIIYNSEAGRLYHESIGYSTHKSMIIPNGFDTNVFKPSIADRLKVRQELNVPDKAILIGMVGRYHPMKGHDTFMRAAALLIKKCPNAKFVLAGKACDRNNTQLYNGLLKLNLANHFYLLGERQDIAIVTAALDIAASSSSSSEGFSNTIGEAMSCGIPCVVSDVGDSRGVVGDTGIVVPAGDPVALLKGWQSLIEMDDAQRVKLGIRARERMIDLYSIQHIVKQYERVYQEVCV